MIIDDIKYEIGRRWRMFDFWMWLADKLPKRLCYYAYIRVHAYATSGQYGSYSPNEVTWDEALKRWEKLYDRR